MNEISASPASAVAAAAMPQVGHASNEEERTLVERAQRGDQHAFRALYMLHADTVFRCAILPLVRDRHLAEDLLADTFVRALEHIDRFRWQGRGLLPWLIRIGKNLSLDHLRRAGRTTAWPDDFEQTLPDLSDSDAESLLGRSQLSDLLRERITACMAELNPRYRRVLELRLIEKRSRQDAAAQLGITIGTLDVLLFRACKSFRKVYLRQFQANTGE